MKELGVSEKDPEFIKVQQVIVAIQQHRLFVNQKQEYARHQLQQQQQQQQSAGNVTTNGNNVRNITQKPAPNAAQPLTSSASSQATTKTTTNAQAVRDKKNTKRRPSINPKTSSDSDSEIESIKSRSTLGEPYHFTIEAACASSY